MNGAQDKGAANRPPLAGGFVKLMRGDDTRDLIEFHPVEFWMISLVAYRARRTPGGGLQPGEALIGVGDAIRAGYTARQYRTAKKRLEACHKTTSRTTSRGTIIILTDASIYDINGFQNDKPNDKQTTTNKNERMKTKEEKIKDPGDTMKPVSRVRFTESDFQLAEHLAELMNRNNPTRKRRSGEIERWAVDFRLMREQDTRTPEQIRAAINFSQIDQFWSQNILSAGNLRKHFDQITLKLKGGHHERGDGGTNRRDSYRPGGRTGETIYPVNDLDSYGDG